MRIKNFAKILIKNILLFLLIIPGLQAKPIPPGSGEGDVPANILILLDSSVSMRNIVTGGNGTYGVDWAVELSDGNIIFSELGRGFSKYLTGTGRRDTTFANGAINFRGSNNDPNCGGNTKVNKSFAGDITSNDTVYGTSTQNSGQIIAIDSAGDCVEVIRYNQTGIKYPRLLEIREIDNEEILFVAGRTHSGGQKGRMYVKNLTNGKQKKCSINNNSHVGKSLRNNAAQSMTVSNDGAFMYMSQNGSFVSYSLSKDANNLYCPTNGEWDLWLNPFQKKVYQRGGVTNEFTDDIKSTFSLKYSRNDNNIIYVGSRHSHVVQKIEVNNTTYTASLEVSIGKYGLGDIFNDKDPGAVAAADVEFNQPGRTSSHNVSNNIFSSSSTILVGDGNGFIHKFDEDKFTTTNKDTAWRLRVGGNRVTKFEGAKDAIEAIVTDSSLTSGANYGFGHWNSGTNDSRGGWAWLPDWPGGGEKYCHFFSACYYYDGWQNGPHPDGESDKCINDYCLNVGVSPQGKDEILDVLPNIGMAWGTDGYSFADMASEYYGNLNGETPVIVYKLDSEGNILLDEDGEKVKELPCQLNYAIVISDGHIKHAEGVFQILADLRKDHKVKTLMVGYGGSYDNVKARPIFDALARAGSCDDPGSYNTPAANTTGCEKAIGANTPEDLKTEIGTKIRQIIAERLSFSAPSITATLEEGGSIYQAQFNYEQHGEWTGHLYRKAIVTNDDGSTEIKHETTYSDENGKNWDAGEQLKIIGSDNRNIWTVLDVDDGGSTNYIGNWNNWKLDNYSQIGELFEASGNVVRDFHHSTSTCKDKEVVAGVSASDGNADDVRGLINFVRGKDYFDYNGGCNLTEDREHLLADIYHSQLVEVGAPNANIDFVSNNEEAYWRLTQGYSAFKTQHQNRRKVIYAGSNGGMLHAFDSSNGKELWGFVPPMIAAQLPLAINKEYDGKFGGDSVKAGGSNAIFGVDGSPVIHDVKIYGLKEDGTGYETIKSWRTLLFIPYGRGGNGFSVLDITNPTLTKAAVNSEGQQVAGDNGKGPLHMFSIFNDTYNKRVIRFDHKGKMVKLPYQRSALNLNDSFEAKRAAENYTLAETTDLAKGPNPLSTPEPGADYFDDREAIDDCQSNADYPGSSFRNDGTNTCFSDTTFTFDIPLPASALTGTTVKDGVLTISQRVSDDWIPIDTATATHDGGSTLTVNFGSVKKHNAGVTSTDASDSIKIETTCEGSGTDNKLFDYSTLGETWSTPRIFRIPSTAGSSDILSDRYVAVMGGGMAISKCTGSGVFIVDLEAGADAEPEGDEGDETGEEEENQLGHHAGALFGTDKLGGPLKILDSDNQGYKMGIEGTFTKGSPITNSIPASPVVITSDASNAPWRGAMVYVNDMEGKITKINLTSSGTMFEQQTLINLETDEKNQRLSYFEMDATIGSSSGDLWLFGGTGDFNRISDTVGIDGKAEMDNIVYGIRDRDFPLFKPHDTYSVLLSGHSDFVESAAKALEFAVPTISASLLCEDTTEDNFPDCNVKPSDNSWRYHLGEADGESLVDTVNMFRKTSAAPTIYRGKVYFPIYEPDKENACNLGTAYVCAYDDECGSLDSMHIDDSVAEGSCFRVGSGILSKLVVFGDSMFANLAGPSATEDTLVEILATEAQFRSYRRSWRENF